MFEADIGLDGGPSLASSDCSTSSAYMTYSESSSSNKHNSSKMHFGKVKNSFVFYAGYQNFYFGVSMYCIFHIFSSDISYIIHGIYIMIMKSERLDPQDIEIKLKGFA